MAAADDALAELEFHWGSAYHLAVIDGVYTAQRRDGKGGTLTDPLPEGLRLLVLADYAAMPVPQGPAVRPESTPRNVRCQLARPPVATMLPPSAAGRPRNPRLASVDDRRALDDRCPACRARRTGGRP